MLWKDRPEGKAYYKAYQKEWFKRNQHKRQTPEYKARCRSRLLKRVYGITIEEYSNMEKIQEFLCAVCRQKETRRLMAVDHDHVTGFVRGLLCSQCNKAIGLFYDDTERLGRAMEYLDEAKMRYFFRNHLGA